jgi:hypothetical protein
MQLTICRNGNIKIKSESLAEIMEAYEAIREIKKKEREATAEKASEVFGKLIESLRATPVEQSEATDPRPSAATESKPRTYRDALNELPEPYRSQALENIEEQREPGYLDRETSLRGLHILGYCFTWANSPQGHDYWEAVEEGHNPELPADTNDDAASLPPERRKFRKGDTIRVSDPNDPYIPSTFVAHYDEESASVGTSYVRHGQRTYPVDWLELVKAVEDAEPVATEAATRKTRKEWAQELPDGYRERAIANLKRAGKSNEKAKALHNAIGGGFIWKSTAEGHDFWHAVRDHYRDGTPLPRLPETDAEAVVSEPQAAPQPGSDGFRYFLDKDGYRWKAPVDGGLSFLKRPRGTEWFHAQVTELSDLLDPVAFSASGRIETDAEGNALAPVAVSSDPLAGMPSSLPPLPAPPEGMRWRYVPESAHDGRRVDRGMSLYFMKDEDTEWCENRDLRPYTEIHYVVAEVLPELAEI